MRRSLSFQQFFQLGLSINPDTVRSQQLRSHPVSFGKRSREGPIINLTMPAGGTSLFQNRSLAVQSLAQTQCLRRSPAVGLRHICA